MFLAWAMLTGLAGEIHVEDFPDDILKLRIRSITPGKFFLQACDGKFTSEDLNEQGNAFTLIYFDFKTGDYLKDYENLLAQSLPSLYHVSDTWENYERLKPTLDRRFAEWQSKT